MTVPTIEEILCDRKRFNIYFRGWEFSESVKTASGIGILCLTCEGLTPSKLQFWRYLDFVIALQPSYAALAQSAKQCCSCAYLQMWIQAKDEYNDNRRNGIIQIPEDKLRVPSNENLPVSLWRWGLGLHLKYGNEIYMDLFDPFDRWQWPVLPEVWPFYITEFIPPDLLHEEIVCPSVDQRFENANHWLNICATEHPSCSQVETSRYFPTRVLAVGIVQGSQNPHLLCSSGWPPDTVIPPYLALSYCWGTGKQFLLTRDNLENWQTGIPFEQLPKTIQDAIVITRKLKVRYLWVDQLCIVQDDEADWEKESANMSDIYTHALCTISASTGEDSNSGCYLDRPPGFGLPKQYSQHPEVSNLAYDWDLTYQNNRQGVARLHFGDIDVLAVIRRGALHTRAWALQERELSRRILNFTQEGLFFECSTAKCSEFRPNPQRRLVEFEDTHLMWTTLSDMDEDRFLGKEWPKLISDEYSGRKLTKESDRLVALSGLASLLQKRFGDEYLAGMWRTRLLFQLSWVTDRKFGAHMGENTPLPYKSQECVAPSWSWVNVACKVNYPRMIIKGSNWDDIAHVESASVEHATADPTGRVSGGRITLRGPWAEIGMCEDCSDRACNGLDGSCCHLGATELPHIINEDDKNARAEVQLDFRPSKPGNKLVFGCLALIYHSACCTKVAPGARRQPLSRPRPGYIGLLLERREGSGEYSRVGHAKLPSTFFESKENRTVTII